MIVCVCVCVQRRGTRLNGCPRSLLPSLPLAFPLLARIKRRKEKTESQMESDRERRERRRRRKRRSVRSDRFMVLHQLKCLNSTFPFGPAPPLITFRERPEGCADRSAAGRRQPTACSPPHRPLHLSHSDQQPAPYTAHSAHETHTHTQCTHTHTHSHACYIYNKHTAYSKCSTQSSVIMSEI